MKTWWIVAVLLVTAVAYADTGTAAYKGFYRGGFGGIHCSTTAPVASSTSVPTATSGFTTTFQTTCNSSGPTLVVNGTLQVDFSPTIIGFTGAYATPQFATPLTVNANATVTITASDNKIYFSSTSPPQLSGIGIAVGATSWNTCTAPLQVSGNTATGKLQCQLTQAQAEPDPSGATMMDMIPGVTLDMIMTSAMESTLSVSGRYQPCYPACTFGQIVVSPTPLDFGSVPINSTTPATRVLAVTNTGTGVLTVSNIVGPAGYTAVSPKTPFTVKPGDTTNVTISFAPTTAGPQNGNLTISSDDPNHSSVTVAVTGTGTGTDKIAFVTVFPKDKQPLEAINLGDSTPQFFAVVVYDLESTDKGQVFLELYATYQDGSAAQLAWSNKPTTVSQRGPGPAYLVIDAITPLRVDIVMYSLFAVLSDPAGNDLVRTDILAYQVIKPTGKVYVGCAAWPSNSAPPDPNSFVNDSSNPTKVFLKENLGRYYQTCPLQGGNGLVFPSVLVQYQSDQDGTIEIASPSGVFGKRAAPASHSGAQMVFNLDAPQDSVATLNGVWYDVYFISNKSGQKTKLDSVLIPIQYVHAGTPTITPTPNLVQGQTRTVSYTLEVNLMESVLGLYRKVEPSQPDFTLVPNASALPLGESRRVDTFPFTPDQDKTLVDYKLDTGVHGAIHAAELEILEAAPAVLNIPGSAAGSTVNGPQSTLGNAQSKTPRTTKARVNAEALDTVIAGLIQGQGPLSGFAVKSAGPQGNALEAASAAVTDYIPIQSTWEFDPPIASDSTFSADITFQYAEAALPDDPNFSEAAMQGISYDPADGKIVSYPTTVDTVAKTAKISVTGLAPYYSLAVLRAPAQTTLGLPIFGSWNPLTAFVNTGSLDANLQVAANSPLGSQDAMPPPSNNLSLHAGEQKSGTAGQLVPASDASATSLRMKSDQPGVAAAQVLSLGDSLEFAAPMGTASPTLVFTDVESNNLFTTSFTLVNTATGVNSVALYLVGQDGKRVASASATIPPLGTFHADAASLFAAMQSPFQGYVVVTGTAGLTAFELIEGPDSAAVLPAQPPTTASSGAVHLYAPHFTWGGGTTSVIHVANPATKDASLTIRLYDDTGKALGQPLPKSLPADQQVSVDVGDILGALSSTALTGSVTVDSTSPTIVGDLSVGDVKSFVTDRAALPLVSTLTPNLVLPYVANDGTTYTASVAVFNPNAGTVAVKISAFGANGASAGSASFNVPANGRIAGALSTLVPAAKGLTAGYVRIDANMPIIAAGLMNSPTGGDSAAMLALPTTGAAGSGTTTPAPKFAASTILLDFGSVAVSQVSDKVVTLQNTGTATLSITSFTPPTGAFTLTAPATPFSIAAGGSQTITVRFAPTGAGGQLGSFKIATNDPAASSFTIGLLGQGTAASTGVKPAFPANGVVNAASYTTSVARCSLASIFGTNLAAANAGAGPLPWPTILGGVQVIVGGVPAPVFVVSPLQINFQVPCEMPLTGTVTMTVNNNGAVSAAQSVTLAPYAPGVFGYYRTASSLDPVIVHVDNSLVTPDKPATANEVLVVYATGVGKLDQLPTTGAASPGLPPAQAVDLPKVTVGGAAAFVQFAGLTPGSVGLVQINIQLPSTLPAGSSLPLVVTFPGAAAPPVNLWVQGSATGPVRGTVLVSDSFNRADAAACSLGRADLANGGSGSHYYLPIYSTGAVVGIVSKALQNLGLDYAGVQLTASSTCGGARGETFAQDLDIAVDLLVPASSAGVVQAGPYFRARAAGAGDGIVGAAGYWVALTSTGEVAIRGLSPNAVIATTGTPSSFDATKFHTLEMVAQGSSLTVYLDNARLTFTQNSASVTTLALPATTGSNDGTVGIAFADEANRSKAGGQRAQNLIIAQPGGTH